jgi:hypothetical protein
MLLILVALTKATSTAGGGAQNLKTFFTKGVLSSTTSTKLDVDEQMSSPPTASKDTLPTSNKPLNTMVSDILNHGPMVALANELDRYKSSDPETAVSPQSRIRFFKLPPTKTNPKPPPTPQPLILTTATLTKNNTDRPVVLVWMSKCNFVKIDSNLLRFGVKILVETMSRSMFRSRYSQTDCPRARTMDTCMHIQQHGFSFSEPSKTQQFNKKNTKLVQRTTNSEYCTNTRELSAKPELYDTIVVTRAQRPNVIVTENNSNVVVLRKAPRTIDTALDQIDVACQGQRGRPVEACMFCKK